MIIQYINKQLNVYYLIRVYQQFNMFLKFKKKKEKRGRNKKY